MTVTTSTNGRARKSLAEQIDRLDGILDGLAEALNGVVADAVQQAVGLAVKEAVTAVLTEVLSNPTVLEKLRAAAAPSPAPAPAGPVAAPPSLLSRLAGRLGGLSGRLAGLARAARAACLARLRQVGRACGDGLRRVGRVARVGWQCLLAFRQWRGQLVIGLTVGTAVGVAAYFVGPWLCGLSGGLGGFTTALAVRARRLLGRT